MMNGMLKVEGMSCGHCVNAVESIAGGHQGVKAIKVDLAKGEVAVEFDSSKTSLIEIQEIIEEKGYRVV